MAYGDLSLDAPLKPNKGHEGGACNRRSCQVEPALHYNHGSDSWYCEQCAHDIGQDAVNLRDWNLNWFPKLGHAMFETREEMNARAHIETETKEPVFMTVEHVPQMSRQQRRAQERSLVKSSGRRLNEKTNPYM